MKPVKILYPLLLLVLLAPATASAQTPPPDERAAARALADAAKKLIAAADAQEDAAPWLDTCKAFEKEPPARHQDAASTYVSGLELRYFVDGLRPALWQFRTEIAAVQTADPVLRSGRAAGRRIARTLSDGIPAGEPDPCAAYEAYVEAGYPDGPAREMGVLAERLDALDTRRIDRKIKAAAARMRALGVSRADARTFRRLAD